MLIFKKAKTNVYLNIKSFFNRSNLDSLVGNSSSHFIKSSTTNNNKFSIFNYQNFLPNKNFSQIAKPKSNDDNNKNSKSKTTTPNKSKSTGIVITSPTTKKPTPKKVLSELDIQAFKEEVKDLLSKKDYIVLYAKLTNMITFLLLDEPEDNFLKLVADYVLLLSDVLRELGRIQESILKQKEVLIKIQSIKTDTAYFLRTKLMDRLSFDCLVYDNMDEALSWSSDLISINKERIQEDKLSLIDDKCTLVANMLNFVQIKLEAKRPNEEIIIDLQNCLELFNELKHKLDSFGFKLHKALGVISFELGNIEDAINYLMTSIKYKRLEGAEEDEETFVVYKCLGECYLDIGDNKKAIENFEKSISVKLLVLEELSYSEMNEEGKDINIEIAKIYEIMAENNLEENSENEKDSNFDISLGLINKAVSYYLKFPVEGIFLAKCYFMLSEIYLEKKENAKSIEYAKKYIAAFEKFIKEHNDEMQDPKFELDYYTRMSLEAHNSHIYKAYKYITNAYASLSDKINTKKYGQLAVDKLIEINKKSEFENDESNDEDVSSNDTLELSDYLNLKYELIKLYETMQSYALAIKECDEVILKLNSIESEKINFEKDHSSSSSSSSASATTNSSSSFKSQSSTIDKNYFIIDIWYSKAEILIKLEKYSEAKKLLAKTQELIHTKNVIVEIERVEDIKNKLTLINIKLKLQNDKNPSQK